MTLIVNTFANLLNADSPSSTLNLNSFNFSNVSSISFFSFSRGESGEVLKENVFSWNFVKLSIKSPTPFEEGDDAGVACCGGL